VVERVAVRVVELFTERLPPLVAAEPWRLLTVEETAKPLGRSTRWCSWHGGVATWDP
jgi:hypothetical protein